MKAPCKHGRYEEHTYLTPGGDPESSIAYRDCPGGIKVDLDVDALRGAWSAILVDDYDSTHVAIVDDAIQVLAALSDNHPTVATEAPSVTLDGETT